MTDRWNVGDYVIYQGKIKVIGYRKLAYNPKTGELIKSIYRFEGEEVDFSGDDFEALK